MPGLPTARNGVALRSGSRISPRALSCDVCDVCDSQLDDRRLCPLPQQPNMSCRIHMLDVSITSRAAETKTNIPSSPPFWRGGEWDGFRSCCLFVEVTGRTVSRWILGFIGVDPLVAPGEVFTSTCQAPAKSLSTVATLADHPYHLGSQRPALYPTQIIQSKKRIGLTSRIAVIAG